MSFFDRFKNKEGQFDKKAFSGRFRRIAPKVGSVVVAVLLWFYVVDIRNTDIERVLNIPVVLENEDAVTDLGFDVISGYDHNIDLTLSGKKNDINNISIDDVSAYVDLRDIDKVGSFDLPVNVKSPAGVSVINKSFSKITVDVDVVSSKEIPVRFEMGEATVDYNVFELLDPTIIPDNVKIEGPKTKIDKISYALAVVDLGEIRSIKTHNVKLKLFEADGNDVTDDSVKISPEYVEVIPNINKTTTVSIIPDFDYQNLDNYVCSDYTISCDRIEIKGDLNLVNGIKALYTKPIDVNSIRNKSVVCDVDIPDGIMVYDNNGNLSEELKVTVDLISFSEVDESGQVVQNNDVISKEIDVKFVPSSYTIDNDGFMLSTPEISHSKVKIEGPKNIVNSISYAKAEAALGKVTSDTTYKVSVVLVDNKGYEVNSSSVDVSPKTVDVKIKLEKAS